MVPTTILRHEHTLPLCLCPFHLAASFSNTNNYLYQAPRTSGVRARAYSQATRERCSTAVGSTPGAPDMAQAVDAEFSDTGTARDGRDGRAAEVRGTAAHSQALGVIPPYVTFFARVQPSHGPCLFLSHCTRSTNVGNIPDPQTKRRFAQREGGGSGAFSMVYIYYLYGSTTCNGC